MFTTMEYISRIFATPIDQIVLIWTLLLESALFYSLNHKNFSACIVIVSKLFENLSFEKNKTVYIGHRDILLNEH